MRIEEVKSALVTALEDAGIGEYEMYYSLGTSVSIDTLNRAVSTFSSSDSHGICLRVLIDGKMGYASTELFDAAEMKSLVERAKENAKSVEKLDTVGIYAGSDSYEDVRVPKYSPMGTGELRRVALDVGERLYAADERVKDGTVSQALTVGVQVGLCNSHGLDLSASYGVNVIAAEAVVAEGEEQQSEFAYTAYGSDRAEDDIAMVVREAACGAVSKLGATDVPSGRYNIVIAGKEMRSLLSVFSGAFSAKSVLDGMSPLKGKEGTVIASEIVTLTDDPQREGNAVGITFDAEGVATHRRAVIDKGVLVTFLHNRETALAMGKETTANASKASYASAVGISPYSFAIEPGEDSLDEIFAKAADGIYVTELKGLHAGANTVTGDFSLESEGFMIRGGKRAEAVRSFTVAGNFFELLKNITALSSEVDRGVQMGITGFGSPAALIPDMPVAGK
ncbi:MAG: TldD/PmbA family protein [Clostridia bacterium]|nr:TldD/PmbA family protein [Clostridia bacterium]